MTLRTKRTKGRRHTTGDKIRASTMLFAVSAFAITGFVSAFSFRASVAQAQVETPPPCMEVPATNFAGHWKFDDAAGTAVADSSGAGHAGTAIGGPTWLTGSASVAHANAIQFDGTDDYVDVPGADFGYPTGSFTVSLFTKAGASAANRSVLGNYSASSRGWGLYYYGNSVNFFAYGDKGVNDATKAATVLDNQWHHVAGVFTRTGDNVKIDTYVDGVLMGTQTAAVGDITSNSSLLLGKYLGQPLYAGAMDDVRVYGRALTAAEVKTFANGCDGTAPSSSSSSVSSSVSSSTSSSVSSSVSSSTSSSTSSSSSSIGNAPSCNGVTATIYVTRKPVRGYDNNWWWRGNDDRRKQQDIIVGGPMNGQVYNGVLRGTDGNDVIVGTDGADVIGGKGGDDRICAGKGNDFVYGDAGTDTVFVGNGSNTVLGNDGNDVVTAGNGRNVILANGGDDTITVGNGANIIDGGTGNNTCHVGHGRNIILRCNGSDMTTNGGIGDDDQGE